MTTVLFKAADVLAALLLALPLLIPRAWVDSQMFVSTETLLVTACAVPFLLAWMPWRGRQASLRIAAWGWLLAAGLNSIIGLCQYFGVAIKVYPWFAYMPLGVAAGNVRQTNLLATLQVISLLALSWLWQTDALPWQKKSVKKAAAVLLAALVLTGLAATASRIGMVELVVAALVVTGYAWNRAKETDAAVPPRLAMRRAGMVGLIALAFYFVMINGLPLLLHDAQGLPGRDLMYRWAHAEDSCNSRFILYDNVLHLIALEPWIGWGWGNLGWANFITIYDGKRICTPWLNNAHNLPLHLAVTLGIPAAIIICGAILYVIWRHRPWRETNPDRQLAWGILLMLGLHSMTEYPLWYAPFQVTVVICLAALWATRPAAQAAPAGAPGAHRRALWLCRGLAVVMLAAAGYATWDYWRIGQLFVPLSMRAPWWRDDPMTPALRSWLYADKVRMALVMNTLVTRENAAQMLPLSILAAHVGPVPDVVGKIIESAAMRGRNELAAAYLERFQLGMPKEYPRWATEHAGLVQHLQSAPALDKPRSRAD